MTDSTASPAATPAQVVARKLLDFYNGDALKWTQGAMARGAGGAELYDDFGDELCVDSFRRVSHPEAACYCIAGADAAARGSGKLLDEEFQQFSRAVQSLTGARAVEFNDAESTTFADVVALLERIAAGEGGAS